MLEVVFILPDEEGRLPRRKDLLDAGVAVSSAVAPAETARRSSHSEQRPRKTATEPEKTPA